MGQLIWSNTLPGSWFKILVMTDRQWDGCLYSVFMLKQHKSKGYRVFEWLKPLIYCSPERRPRSWLTNTPDNLEANIVYCQNLQNQSGSRGSVWKEVIEGLPQNVSGSTPTEEFTTAVTFLICYGDISFFMSSHWFTRLDLIHCFTFCSRLDDSKQQLQMHIHRSVAALQMSDNCLFISEVIFGCKELYNEVPKKCFWSCLLSVFLVVNSSTQ